MQRIVLDTNSLILAISSRNRYHEVWLAFLRGDYVLCITNEILEEYMEVIARNINLRVAEAIIYTLLTRDNVKRFAPHYHFHLIQADEDDNKFVDCAIVANARYIVTEDHHFDILKSIPFPSIEVVSIDEFLRQLETLR